MSLPTNLLCEVGCVLLLCDTPLFPAARMPFPSELEHLQKGSLSLQSSNTTFLTFKILLIKKYNPIKMIRALKVKVMCGGLNNNNNPIDQCVWMVGPQLLEQFGKAWEAWSYWKKCDTGASNAPTLSVVSLFLCLMGVVSRFKISTTAPVLCLPACCQAPYHDGHRITLWKLKAE